MNIFILKLAIAVIPLILLIATVAAGAAFHHPLRRRRNGHRHSLGLGAPLR